MISSVRYKYTYTLWRFVTKIRRFYDTVIRIFIRIVLYIFRPALVAYFSKSPRTRQRKFRVAESPNRRYNARLNKYRKIFNFFFISNQKIINNKKIFANIYYLISKNGRGRICESFLRNRVGPRPLGTCFTDATTWRMQFVTYRADRTAPSVRRDRLLAVAGRNLHFNLTLVALSILSDPTGIFSRDKVTIRNIICRRFQFFLYTHTQISGTGIRQTFGADRRDSEVLGAVRKSDRSPPV